MIVRFCTSASMLLTALILIGALGCSTIHRGRQLASIADDHPHIAASADLCPSYAPHSGPTACDPTTVADEINSLPHPLEWTGTADPQWNQSHMPCNSAESFDQLGKEIDQYRENPLHFTPQGYWSMGVFVRLRASIPGFWDMRKKYVEDFFHSTVSNSEIRAACCKGNGLCLKRFSEVKLNTADGDEAEYDPATHTIFVSKKLLLQEIYNEPIKWLVLHELGHACDQSIYYSENPSNPTSINDLSNLEQEIAHIESRFGNNFYACIKEASARDSHPMDSHSAVEAFATGIFAFRFQDALSWNSLMPDLLGYRWGEECILKTPELKRQVCNPIPR